MLKALNDKVVVANVGVIVPEYVGLYLISFVVELYERNDVTSVVVETGDTNNPEFPGLSTTPDAFRAIEFAA